MLTKQIDCHVDAKTFPSNRVPGRLKSNPRIDIDLKKALFILGQLTIPGGLTRASPARTWAWIRYFSAISTSQELRISAPFVDLDPHQKSILSDDFGVAVSMCWFLDRLGAFREVVDGRRFVLQLGHFLRKKKRSTPKVGRGKCPDFVVRDQAGKWHIFECKGTQSGSYYRDEQLKVAVLQKRCIDIAGSRKGFALAGGIYLAGENALDEKTNLRVVDPDEIDEPYITIDSSSLSEAKAIATRLAVSRALGLAGVSELSEELSLPPEAEGFEDLYTVRERARLMRSRQARTESAIKEVFERPARQFSVGGDIYRGRSVEIEVPGSEFYMNSGGFTRIRVDQGVNEDFVQRIASGAGDILDRVDKEAASAISGQAVDVQAFDDRVVLKQGELYFSRMELLE